MIIIKFTGGLGNQLYQYALYRTLCLNYPGIKIKADISSYKLYDAHYGYELDRIFGKKGKQIVPVAGIVEQYIHCGEIPIFCSGVIGKKIEIPIAWFNARSRKWFDNRRMVCRLDEERINDNFSGKEKAIYIKEKLEKLDVGSNWYIAGYWQDELIFERDIPKLCEELEFPMFTDAINLGWKEKIEKCNSVSVHVRRGDYVGSKYDVLTMDYYKQAVKYIKEHVDNPIFFVFSEDNEYVERAFGWLKNKYIISNNHGKDSYKDMQMMSLCRHNIIANSSFSQWAAYLNRHSDKIVLYPSRYTRDEDVTEKFGSGWHRIIV